MDFSIIFYYVKEVICKFLSFVPLHSYYTLENMEGLIESTGDSKENPQSKGSI